MSPKNVLCATGNVPTVISGALTKLLQPLDISVSRYFKAELKSDLGELDDNWREELIHSNGKDEKGILQHRLPVSLRSLERRPRYSHHWWLYQSQHCRRPTTQRGSTTSLCQVSWWSSPGTGCPFPQQQWRVRLRWIFRRWGLTNLCQVTVNSCVNVASTVQAIWLNIVLLNFTNF